MKNKKDSVDKDEVFRVFTLLMDVCDDEMHEGLSKGYQLGENYADITEVAQAMLEVLMAVEFSYVCYRNRLTYFMQAINNATETDTFEDDDARTVVEYARSALKPVLKSVIMADRKMFEKSLEVVSLEDEIAPERKINVKGGGEA